MGSVRGMGGIMCPVVGMCSAGIVVWLLGFFDTSEMGFASCFYPQFLARCFVSKEGQAVLRVLR